MAKRREPSEIVARTKPLSPEQERAAHLFADQNKNKYEIASIMGTTPAAVSRVLNQEHVSHEVAKRREDLRIKTKTTREDVANIFLDSVEMARVMAEPATMIQGGRELGKMLGYYEPEKVQVEISHSSQDFQNQLRTLTDAQLYELLEQEKEVQGEVIEHGVQSGSS